MLVINMIFLYAQKLSISGKISDSDKKPVENATVYLLRQKDSSIVNYTATNKEGNFSLKTDKLYEPTLLKIDADKLTSYFKKIETIEESFYLSEIELEKNKMINIDEIKLSISPVKIKKDTIEFNASFFKVSADHNIKELLKNIPGVEISNDGKITVNGKKADKILINGKPFFDKDGKIALQNIPADIIKNIQFTTTKTKEEELSEKSSKSNNTTINFNIDEKKNKGLISRLTVGYGSDKRYEGSSLFIYFKNNTRISLLASSNNINSEGFSRDEVFDSMGNGRNSEAMQGYKIQEGIKRSSTIGFSYSDKLGVNGDLETFSLMHAKSNLETKSKVSRTTLLPDFTLKTDSESNGKNESQDSRFETSAIIKLDSLTTVVISPSFTRTEGFSFSNTKSSTSKNNTLLNESDSYTSSDSKNNTFTPNIDFSKKLKKTGRVLSANINSSISESNTNNLNRSQNIFYQGTDTNDNRNQLAKNKSQNNTYSFTAAYSEPITDSISLSTRINYETKQSQNLRNVGDFDITTGQYSNHNISLSNNMGQKINTISPELSFELNKKKISIWTSASFDIAEMKVNSTFNGKQYDLQKSFVLPKYYMNVNYSFSETKKLYLSNYSAFTIPSAEQITPYRDTSDPLITYLGNPELKNPWTNTTSLYFSNYNIIKDVTYYFMLNFNYGNNNIINYSKYDNSGKQLVTYDNISGTKSIDASGNYSKTFKWKEHTLTINPTFNITYAYDKGFINGQQFTSNTYRINPSLNFTYEIKGKFTIKPSYRIEYNSSNYTNYSVDQVNTTNQVLKMEMTHYLLKSKFVFGNDFEYNTSSNISPGFKKDFYFWNTSLGYSFLKEQLIAKVKIYDVLNQNQSIKRMITNSYFEDREDLILKRYIMLSLSMKLNKFGGKKVS